MVNQGNYLVTQEEIVHIRDKRRNLNASFYEGLQITTMGTIPLARTPEGQEGRLLRKILHRVQGRQRRKTR
ncbi:unnamed protein product [Acanthoscelides obtectus]|uniref:Uncharacterized protein n=1 Tax=Acanthoscelides obtectus TaxID=200917 RepID=A0A9P0M0U8_ACAOB|nr:unnamed protein product [Acanthoscelides obtectus]CAK1679485.1 hypothetical protein AOBTE_LOCUS32283 [Acanthoscelides obtectus]